MPPVSLICKQLVPVLGQILTLQSSEMEEPNPVTHEMTWLGCWKLHQRFKSIFGLQATSRQTVLCLWNAKEEVKSTYQLMWDMYSDRGIDFIDWFICGFPVPLWNLVKEQWRKLRVGTSADIHTYVCVSPLFYVCHTWNTKSSIRFRLFLSSQLPHQAHWITTDTQTKPSGPRPPRHTQTNTDQVTPPPGQHGSTWAMSPWGADIL